MSNALRYLLFICILLIVACRKDTFVNDVTIEEAPPLTLVYSTFKGKVTDESGQPVSGARVTVYNSTSLTNARGLFEIKNIKAPKGAALVTVEKNGYFTGASMSDTRADSRQFVQVTLLEKGAPQAFNVTSGLTLAQPNGLKITVQPDQLLLANGNVFNGTANVYARWLDPSDPNLGRDMPGALMARDDKGKEVVLATYGMVALDFETTNGDPLKFKENGVATVEMPIPADLLGDAPDEIPLWYFDLEEERWLQKGLCKKSGGAYPCQITKTGYWNCDVPLEAICLSGTIFQSDSTPAFYTKVIIEDLTDNFIYWGYTDLEGFFCGSVPKGALLKITIKDLCDNILYEANIGPFSMDTDLGDIYLNQSLSQYFIRITGQLNDCTGAAVTSGQIAVQYPGKIRLFPLSGPGTFDFQMALNCIEFPELSIVGYDLTTFKASNIVLHSDSSDLNTGVLTACTNPTDFMRITADGINYNFAPTRFYLKNNVTTNWMVLEGLTVGGTASVELRQYTGPGTYSVNAFFYMTDNPINPVYPILDAASPDITVVITSDDGTFISGTITGTAYDALLNPHPVSGDFNIKKKI